MHITKLIVERSKGAVAPYIQANVAGHPLRLLVDTGAPQSLLPAGFVRKFKLRTRSNSGDAVLIDVNGQTLRMPTVPDVTVQFEGETSVQTLDFLLNNADPSATIGILAPQELVRSGWVLVIDFEHDELRYEPEEGALKRLGGPASSLQEIDYHRCHFDNHRVASATINGVPTSLMIDTGRPSLGPLPVSKTCGKGLLGADAISQCIMIWGSKSLWAACHARPKSE